MRLNKKLLKHMKLTTILTLLVTLFITQISFSQNLNKELSLDKGTIDQQFEYIIKKSSRYENYKVIKYSWINQLKSHVNDSISKLKLDIVASQKEILAKEKAYNALQEELNSVSTKLTATTKAKDNIQFLGMSLSKGFYKTLMWSLIALLSIALLFFIYQFKNSHVVTKKTIQDFKELELAYNTSKTRALEREQVLNRKLQDEINKQKNK